MKVDLFEAVRKAVAIQNVAAIHGATSEPRAGPKARVHCVCGQRGRHPCIAIYDEECGHGHAHCFKCATPFGDCIALHAYATTGRTDNAARLEACRDLAQRFGVTAHDAIASGKVNGQICSLESRCAGLATPPPAQTTFTPAPWAVDVLEAATEHYRAQLARTPSAQAYLRIRGLTEETIRAMRIGYALGRGLVPALAEALTCQGLDEEALSRVGLATPDRGEFLRRRIVFPIAGDEGRVVFLIGRATQADQEPKYLSLANSDHLRRQPLVYGRAVKGVLVVEGP